MYWYEKDYIMRMIHGIAQILAALWFGRRETELPSVMSEQCGAENDYLRRLVDSGQINAAEDRLFEILETAGWDSEQKAALILSFFHVPLEEWGTRLDLILLWITVGLAVLAMVVYAAEYLRSLKKPRE